LSVEVITAATAPSGDHHPRHVERDTDGGEEERALARGAEEVGHQADLHDDERGDADGGTGRPPRAEEPDDDGLGQQHHGAEHPRRTRRPE